MGAPKLLGGRRYRRGNPQRRHQCNRGISHLQGTPLATYDLPVEVSQPRRRRLPALWSPQLLTLGSARQLGVADGLELAADAKEEAALPLLQAHLQKRLEVIVLFEALQKGTRLDRPRTRRRDDGQSLWRRLVRRKGGARVDTGCLPNTRQPRVQGWAVLTRSSSAARAPWLLQGRKPFGRVLGEAVDNAWPDWGVRKDGPAGRASGAVLSHATLSHYSGAGHRDSHAAAVTRQTGRDGRATAGATAPTAGAALGPTPLSRAVRAPLPVLLVAIVVRLDLDSAAGALQSRINKRRVQTNKRFV